MEPTWAHDPDENFHTATALELPANATCGTPEAERTNDGLVSPDAVATFPPTCVHEDPDNFHTDTALELSTNATYGTPVDETATEGLARVAAVPTFPPTCVHDEEEDVHTATLLELSTNATNLKVVGAGVAVGRGGGSASNGVVTGGVGNELAVASHETAPVDRAPAGAENLGDCDTPVGVTTGDTAPPPAAAVTTDADAMTGLTSSGLTATFADVEARRRRPRAAGVRGWQPTEKGKKVVVDVV